MKKLILKLVIPLTILSFLFLPKWWLVNVPDGPNEIVYSGFPFIYLGPGFHTSMSLHFFILPLIADIIVYFTICCILVYTINHIKTIRLHKLIVILLWIITALPLSVALYIAFLPDNICSIYRDFDIEVLKTGFGTFDKQAYWEAKDKETQEKLNKQTEESKP